MANVTTFGFIGLGLIGGSMAKAIRKISPDCQMMAYQRTRSSLEDALSDGVLNKICDGFEDPAWADCDMIFLCAPVGVNALAMESLKDIIKPSCILTDVGSTKTGIHKEAEKIGMNAHFIGGHPMAGSEKTGYANATDHMFENAYYILTPTTETPAAMMQALEKLVTEIGAIPLVLDYQEHDYITAAISHLPHVIASSLVNTVHNLDNPQEHMKLIAAGGFKDITRIASSSPDMWEHICVENNDNIGKVMDEFIRLLSEARDHMNQGDGHYINEMFEHSRDYRNSFNDSSMGPIKKTYRIYCDIIDESGAIATIATILSVNGISIKNIGIVHNREFEEGALKIEFYEEEPTLRAAQVLRQHRYTVWETK